VGAAADPSLLTIAQAAVQVGMTRLHTQREVEAGRIRTVQVEDEVRVPVEALMRYVREAFAAVMEPRGRR
jgi:excisionase family DNA binding protein